jgi:hypothetical protein
MLLQPNYQQASKKYNVFNAIRGGTAQGAVRLKFHGRLMAILRL